MACSPWISDSSSRENLGSTIHAHANGAYPKTRYTEPVPCWGQRARSSSTTSSADLPHGSTRTASPTRPGPPPSAKCGSSVGAQGSGPPRGCWSGTATARSWFMTGRPTLRFTRLSIWNPSWARLRNGCHHIPTRCTASLGGCKRRTEQKSSLPCLRTRSAWRMPAERVSCAGNGPW